MTIYSKDYEITEVIHETTTTTIFRGFRKADHLSVILKLLKPEYINDRSSKKIENEFNFLNKIHAPQVIHAYELIPFQKTLLLVLEEFSSKTLRHYIKEDPVDIKSLLEIAIDIAEGIGRIHMNNIIHKDIKPSNILINAKHKIKIIDFGIGTSLAREVQQEIQPEQLEGTISYISPEQTARMNRPIDYRTDIYSFGVTLYELFTHQLPFNANTPIELIHLHIARKPISPSKVNSDIPDIISDIILKCMEKNPDDRYKSAFGLKKDLERCLDNILSSQTIPRFHLGQNDVYDKFFPPKGLYGRNNELKIINQCIEEVWIGRAQLMTLSGPPGIGKTRLIEEAEKFVSLKEGHFFTVTYDHFKEKIPFYGIATIYKEIIHKILTRTSEEVEDWRIKILDCVEGKGQILIDIIPDLKLIIGEQPKVDELPPQESENRFKYLFNKFMKLMIDPKHPLVLVFDNFQCGDESTIKLLTDLLSNNTLLHILVIASYRDNEPFHHLSQAMKELEDSSLKITNLTISPLDIDSVELIVKEVFPGIEKITVLSYVIIQKTFGNAFFVVQFLKYLYGKEIIQFDYQKMLWNASIDKVTSLEISENVVELLVKKIEMLDPQVLDFLKVCSVIGNQFEFNTIVKFFGNHVKETNQLIETALKEEYITQVVNVQDKNSRFYQFTHERIRQLFYGVIEEDEKKQIHYQIGHILFETLPGHLVDEEIVSIVNHINYGMDFHLDDTMKEELISLNLKAGLKIFNSQAYLQAIPYFKNAISLLGNNSWEEKYAETYILHKNIGICQMLVGDVDQAETHFNLCLKRAKTDKDKFEINTNTMLLVAQVKDYDKLFTCGKYALDLLDFPFDMNPGIVSAVMHLIKMKAKLALYSTKQLEELPLVNNERLANITTILAGLGHSSYVTGKQFLWLKLTLTMMEIALKYGVVSQNCGTAFIGYGVFLGSEQMGDFDGSFKYGYLGFQMMNRCSSTPTALLGKLVYPYFIRRNKYPYRESLPLIEDAYKECMMSGNIPVSAQSIVSLVAIGLVIGQRLSIINTIITERISEFKKLNVHAEYNNLLFFKEFCQALQGEKSDPLAFCPTEFADEVFEKREIRADSLYLLSYRMWHGIMLYMYNRYNDAKEELHELLPLNEKFPGIVEWTPVYLCYALSLAAQFGSPKDNPKEWKQLLRINKMLSKWNKTCPIRYEIYSLLVQGEVARIQNNSIKVIQSFSQAIRKAKIEENYFLIGVGYELFARYYMNLGVTDLTVLFIEKALYFFETWGAVAKCNHMKLIYGDYLSAHESPVNVGSEFGLWTDDMTHQTTMATINYETINTISTTLSSVGGESSFDLSTIIEASQTLSREIEFDRLVQSLMNLMIVNAGANKAFLIIYENNRPYIYSEIYIGEPYIPLESPLPLEERNDEICIQVVEYVGRARKDIVLNKATEKGPFYQDTYIQTKKPKSILCLPLLQNENLKGILYLENTETINAFTQNHMRLLNLLSSQIAISIENAKFYTNLEVKVQSRTQELEEKNIELNQALKHIQDTQNQLIQKEKLASLGVLTAGIAHELKNPLNFVINFAQIIKDTLADLKEEIKTGSKEDKLMLVNEMIANLDVIDTHGQRSNSIIKGMLSHSHQGSKTLEDVDLNALVDQAFGLAYYTFRKKEPTFNLTVKKSYENNLPIIKGYAGDVLRVFINIIDNACYAIFEKMKKSVEEYQPQFEIKTYHEGDYIVVLLKDNGPGIPQEYLNKVFNPFFTTKPAGSGTGLGLSIAYDIIAKEHSGKLEVNSKQGEMTEFIISLPERKEGKL